MASETRVLERMGRCVHFTGIQNVKCAAGVSYADARVEHEPVSYQPKRSRTMGTARTSLPCIDDLNHCGATCEKCEKPRREDVEREVAESDAAIDRTMAAMAAVNVDASKVKGGSGTVACPTCGGVLHWSKAAINGHVWGQCETPECVTWMM